MAWENRASPDPVRRPRYDVYALPGPATPKDNLIPPTGVRLTSVIEHLQTSKDLSSPVGTFELRCTYEEVGGFPGRPISQLLIPGNVVDIWLDTGLPETTLEMVMRGYVVGVEERETMDGRGRPVRSIAVFGTDCGGWFMKHSTPLFLYTSYTLGDAEWQKRVQTLSSQGGALGEVLRHIFIGVFTQIAPLNAVVEDGQLLTEPLLDNVDDGTDDYWPASTQMTNFPIDGQFWNIYSMYSDDPWVETFGDYVPDPSTSHFASYNMATLRGEGVEKAPASTGGAGYYLISRRRPFSAERWSALPTTILFDNEIKMASTRYDDAQRVNVVYASPGGVGFESTAQIPVWALDARFVHRDEDSMRRYGTCMLSRKTIYLPNPDQAKNPTSQADTAKGQGDIVAWQQRRADALWRWFSINHKLRSGTLITAGIPSIRIGERVTGQPSTLSTAYLVSGYPGFAAEQVRRDWYVQRVVHDFTDGGAFLTNLGVVRGQPKDGFISALIDVVLSDFNLTAIDWTKVSDWHPPMKLPGT